MNTNDIKNMARAYQSVVNRVEESVKIDPVNKSELKGTHAQRKDKDIDNDGKVDSSDEYLHKRRQAISKSKEKEVETTEATMTQKQKMAALAKAKAQPKDKVSLKKAPWDEKNESVQWPVFARIVEKRDMHMKGATPPEEIDSKDSVNAKKFKAMHGQSIPDAVDEPKVDAKNFADQTKNVKVAPKRHGDQTTGDKSIIKSK